MTMKEETKQKVILAAAVAGWPTAVGLSALRSADVIPSSSLAWVIIATGVAVTASLNIRSNSIRSAAKQIFQAGMDAERERAKRKKSS